MEDTAETEIAAKLKTTERLLRKVLVGVINAGRADILWDMPDVLEFTGSRIPERHEVAHLHNVNEQMLQAGERNRANALRKQRNSA